MKFKTGFIKGFRGVLLLCFGAFLLGCVSATSKNMTANFGSAAKTLTSETETNITKVRNSDSNFTISIVLGDKNLGVASGLVLPEIKQEDIALRLTLLREITKYADALLVMSSDVEAIRIDKASRDLYGALGALNKTVQSQSKGSTPLISNNDLQLVASATNVVGQWFFEKARLEALQTSVKKADPVIAKAVDLLKTEITESGPWSSSLGKSLKSEAKNIYMVAQSINNVKDRRIMLTEAQQLYEQADSVKGAFKRLNSSLEELKKSHSALAVALENDSDVNIQNALDGLSKLEDEVIRIYAFQASLTDNNKK